MLFLSGSTATQSQRVCPAAQPCAQFIELDVRHLEMPKGADVQRRTMSASTSQPSRDGRVAMAEHTHCSGDKEPFRPSSQHFRNPLGCGFQTIERRIAPGAEGGSTRLAA